MRGYAVGAVLILTAAEACARQRPAQTPELEQSPTARPQHTYVAQSTISVSVRQATRCANRTIRELQSGPDREFTNSLVGRAAETAPSPHGDGPVANYYRAVVEDVAGRLMLRVYATSAVFPASGSGEGRSNASRIGPTAEARALADRVVASCSRQGSRSA